MEDMERESELQIYFHDALHHPLRIFSNSNAGKFKIKITATSKIKNEIIQSDIKILSERQYQKIADDHEGFEYENGNFISCCFKAASINNVVLNFEIMDVGISSLPCSLLNGHSGEMQVPVRRREDNADVGIIRFDYLVIELLNASVVLERGKDGIPFWHNDGEKGKRSLEMGHRGCGSTHGKPRSPGNPIENTIHSFRTAFEKGADYVELDVQLSKDLVPIVFHDFYAAVMVKQFSGGTRKLTVPVNGLTLEEMSSIEIMSVGEEQTERSSEALNDDEGLFPSLEKVLRESPKNLGIFIEMKFPMQELNGAWEADFQPDKNKLVEKTLAVVFSHAEERRIIFGSFDPATCIMLKRKQPFYPVVFISSCENNDYPSCMDLRCRTFKMAVNFAKSEELLGISVFSNPLKESIVEQLADAKKEGIELFTWGGANTDKDFIKKQRNIEVTGIIYDRLHELRLS
eukprot:Seg1841.4 transcript_id=Seg1841.4/GoldUCD/mRNA.D3Y31 product="Glycerophosphocholine phosphodiesterase GPCPD1" pseudo=true protein_id=Seg1841.4/GoldUCD/D3Y31